MTTRYLWVGVAALALASGCGAKRASKMAASEAAPMAGMPDMAPEANTGAGDGARDLAQVKAADAVKDERKAGPATVAKIDGDREFAAPSFQKSEVRRDFRETIFWSASVTTDASGEGAVSFSTSDAVTKFRATMEGIAGGRAGHAELGFASVLPLSIAAKLPTEVTPGDRLRVPVTVTNRTERGKRVALKISRGSSLSIRSHAKPSIWVPAKSERTVNVSFDVVAASQKSDAGFIKIAASAGKHSDVLQRELKVAPPGFPRDIDFGGTLTKTATHKLKLPADVVPGTLTATLQFYPSPTSSLMSGVEAIVREPHGCFEQASSANYPNVMALSYMKQNNALEPAIVAKTRGPLERGYKKLVGYESDEKGFEWFGGNPGHEALTAYGLMQFKEMATVYPSVDGSMVKRTARWLKSRRDGKGGYKRNSRALDSFGRASADVTDSYITYALTEAGEQDMPNEIARARKLAAESKDAYVLALATNSLLNVEPTSEAATGAVDKLIGLQQDDGSFSGAKESITRSGGVALQIETTALASMALLKGSPRARAKAGKALRWIEGKRNGRGGFSSTQATVLALKALTSESQAGSAFEPGSSVEVLVDGEVVERIALKGEGNEPIRYDGIARHLRQGENRVELRTGGKVRLAYSFGVSYRQKRPMSSAATAVAITTRLAKRRIRAGRAVAMKVNVKNTQAKGLPMVIARVGIPGGLTFQRWQLDELVKKGDIDFYETREREVILYWRAMPPSATASLDLQLLAAVPGRFNSPPSSAYLYYTDEHKDFAAPTSIVVTKSVVARKKTKEVSRVSQ